MSTTTTIENEMLSGVPVIRVDNAHASAVVSLFGGQVLSFIPKSDDQERLWVSPHANLDAKKPIRGGVPVCWPWFSDSHGMQKGELPSHGFLRTQTWTLTDSQQNDDATTLVLTPSFTRAKGFEFACEVTLTIEIGQQLRISLSTTNSGDTPFTFTGALHTYFTVPDIHHVALSGLSDTYLDKNNDFAATPSPSPYVLRGETDRIHEQDDADTTILYNGKPFTRVVHQQSDSVVVWTPWHGAAFISDMDAFSFNHMVCVETAITKGKTLSPGEVHTLTQIISAGE
ncbi:D-hexose-6-phosphate mutarotase [Alteromonas sp. CYL-A6]|uniref:D-hexose-6-phosphate mutarotase n=1 Tax=Alteromonas nitratireducens TaxID=3390813 RepID=UPI0034C0607E